MSKAVLKLQSALVATGMLQPVSEKAKGGYLEVLCRQVPGQEKGWLQVMGAILQHAEAFPDIEFHVCRRYVLRNGSMVFGWHIALTCKSLKALQVAVDSLVDEVLTKVRPTLSEPEPTISPPVARQEAVQPRRQPLAPGQHPQRMPPPRPPNEPGTVVGEAPRNFAPAVRVVQNARDQQGKLHIVEEMPLPHVYSEMNVPNEKGKGAKYTGGGG